jgi:dienelactone hydrolase
MLLFWIVYLTMLSLTVFASSHSEHIKFESLDSKMRVSGELFMPPNAVGKVPAVIVVHGTAGVDERTKYFARELPKTGIAVFMVDFKHGVFTDPSNRPLDGAFQPAAFAALRILRQRADIDGSKIGIMGFSLGGHLSLTTALVENKTKWIGEEPGFKVHVAYYPVCKYFLRKLKPESRIVAPIKAYWGTLDSYGDGQFCPQLKTALAPVTNSEVDLVEYEGAYHGFDSSSVGEFYDPVAIAGRGYIAGNASYAKKAREESIKFLIKYLQ